MLAQQSLSVCMSVTVKHPAKSLNPMDGMRCHLAAALAWSQVTLWQSGAPVHHWNGRFGGQNPQYAAMLPVAKLLWPSYYYHYYKLQFLFNALMPWVGDSKSTGPVRRGASTTHRSSLLGDTAKPASTPAKKWPVKRKLVTTAPVLVITKSIKMSQYTYTDIRNLIKRLVKCILINCTWRSYDNIQTRSWAAAEKPSNASYHSHTGILHVNYSVNSWPRSTYKHVHCQHALSNITAPATEKNNQIFSCLFWYMLYIHVSQKKSCSFVKSFPKLDLFHPFPQNSVISHCGP